MQPCHACGRAATDAVPQRTRSPRLNRLLALAAVAVVLVAAVVGVILIRADDRPGAPGSTAAPASASASAPSINECVLGSWTVDRATTTMFIDDDIVEFTNTGGLTWRLNADGTGEYSFGRGATYVGSHGGEQITYTYVGVVTFTFATDPSRQLRLDNVRLGAETAAKVSVRGTSVEAGVSGRPDSLTYTCGDNSLSIVDEVREFDLRRA
jgi:hypothetical protein